MKKTGGAIVELQFADTSHSFRQLNGRRLWFVVESGTDARLVDGINSGIAKPWRKDPDLMAFLKSL